MWFDGLPIVFFVLFDGLFMFGVKTNVAWWVFKIAWYVLKGVFEFVLCFMCLFLIFGGVWWSVDGVCWCLIVFDGVWWRLKLFPFFLFLRGVLKVGVKVAFEKLWWVASGFGGVSLHLRFVVCVCSSLDLNSEADLRFRFEIEVSVWGFDLKFRCRFEISIWGSNLRFRFEVPLWGFDSRFRSDVSEEF